MSMRYPGGVISATPPTITPPVDGEGGTASGVWTLETQLQNAGVWPKPVIPRELWSWGYNTKGSLGLNDTANRSSPTQVGALSNWKQVSISNFFAAAIKTDGTLWTWGANSAGQLGQNNTINLSSPVQIGALSDWKEVCVSGGFAIAVKKGGTLWAWGAGTNGALGTNSIANRSSPVQIGALTTWSKVSCGGTSSFAIKNDGTLWSWGSNNNGQLGQNLYYATNRSSPVQVGALTTWSSVSAGNSHAIAVKTDGTLWAWGANEYGRLGINLSGYAENRSSPVQVGALTTWVGVSALFQSSSAISTNGTLWTWGKNDAGQLGQNSTVDRSSPVQVGALTNWAKISGSVNFMASIKTDGTLWAWGANSDGQLGQNNTIGRSSPVQVGVLTTWTNLFAGSNSLAIAALKTP